jgi:hypothetical protein
VSRQTLGSSWPASANWAAEIDSSVGLHVTLLRSHPLTCDRLDRAQAVAFDARHLCRGKSAVALSIVLSDRDGPVPIFQVYNRLSSAIVRIWLAVLGILTRQ